MQHNGSLQANVLRGPSGHRSVKVQDPIFDAERTGWDCRRYVNDQRAAVLSCWISAVLIQRAGTTDSRHPRNPNVSVCLLHKLSHKLFPRISGKSDILKDKTAFCSSTWWSVTETRKNMSMTYRTESRELANSCCFARISYIPWFCNT